MHRSLVLAASLAFAAAPAQAQGTAPDTLPFRAGQWGAEFGVSNGVSGVGGLRFFSQRTALEANIGMSLDRMRVDEFSSNSWEYTSVDLRLGVRRYRSLGADVAGFLSIGALGGYSHSEAVPSPADPIPPMTQNTARVAGAYLQLGGQYHVTPRLSLGAMYGATAVYRHTHSEPDDVTRSGWGAGTPPVQLRISLFF